MEMNISSVLESTKTTKDGFSSYGTPLFREDGFGSTTYGHQGYRKLDDLTLEPITLDAKLDIRLSILCDKLRAKY